MLLIFITCCKHIYSTCERGEQAFIDVISVLKVRLDVAEITKYGLTQSLLSSSISRLNRSPAFSKISQTFTQSGSELRDEMTFSCMTISHMARRT